MLGPEEPSIYLSCHADAVHILKHLISFLFIKMENDWWLVILLPETTLLAIMGICDDWKFMESLFFLNSTFYSSTVQSNWSQCLP